MRVNTRYINSTVGTSSNLRNWPFVFGCCLFKNGNAHSAQTHSRNRPAVLQTSSFEGKLRESIVFWFLKKIFFLCLYHPFMNTHPVNLRHSHGFLKPKAGLRQPPVNTTVFILFACNGDRDVKRRGSFARQPSPKNYQRRPKFWNVFGREAAVIDSILPLWNVPH